MASSDRCFPNTLPEEPWSAIDVDKCSIALKDALKVITDAADREEDLAGGTVYVGLAGVALVYLKVWQKLQAGAQLPEGLQHITAERALFKVLDICDRAMPLISSNTRVTFLEGLSGLLALRAVALQHLGRKQEAAAQVAVLLSYYGQAVQRLGAGECELLYGRAGYLYSLLFAQQHMGQLPQAQPILQELVQHIVQAGQSTAAALPAAAGTWPLMYSWHGSLYLGGAHGLAGIALMLLYCRQHLSGQQLQLVEQTVQALSAHCFPSGNLPSSLGREADKLVHWCHGATGLVPLLCEAHHASHPGVPSSPHLQHAAKSAAVVWQRGLLRKGVGLCHGISGSAYALLSLHRASGDALQLHRAQQMAAFAAQHWRQLYNAPDRPASLFEGLAGAVCLWLDLLVLPPRVAGAAAPAGPAGAIGGGGGGSGGGGEEEAGGASELPADVLFPGYEVLLPG